MKYVIFDTETTGLNPGIDDVIQLSYLCLDDEGNIIDAKNSYCNTDVPISQGAYKVHGIDKKYLDEVAGNTFLSDLVLYDSTFTNMDEDVVFIAYNVSFDTRMINEKLKRRGYKPPKFGYTITTLNQKHGRYNYCLMKGLTKAMDWGKNKSLANVRNMLLSDVTDQDIESLIEQLKDNFDITIREGSGFHDAMYDVVVTSILFYRYKDRL